jgi:integrase/recombinase XerD
MSDGGNRWLDLCVQTWRQQGYGRGVINSRMRWVRLFLEYCARRGLAPAAHLTLASTRHFVASYVRARGVSWFAAFRDARSTLRACSRVLQSAGAYGPPWRPLQGPEVRDPLLQEYAAHRRRWRPVANHMLRLELHQLARFRRWLRYHRRGQALERLRPVDLDDFIVFMGQHASAALVSTVATALRMFLRFLHVTGRLPMDLSAHVARPVGSAARRISRVLSWREVRRMLAQVNRRTAVGRRDFAVLLTMATYGMGAAEAFNLKLPDVDWLRGTLCVVRPKTGTQTLLPLLPPVGKAILAYLRRGRPRCSEGDAVFVSARPPYCWVRNPGVVVRHMLKKYAAAAGVSLPSAGAHILRHTHVSRQVDAGVSPRVISDIIGHTHAPAISPYVRIAIERLRSVSLPIP